MGLKLNAANGGGSVELNVPDTVNSDLALTIPATAGEVAVVATDGSVDFGDVTIDSSGNVGIGTSSPSYITDIKADGGGATERVRIFNTGSAAGDDALLEIKTGGTGNESMIWFGDSDDNNVGQIRYDHANDEMEFYVNAADRLRIKSNGFVGIGDINPEGKLHLGTGDNDDGTDIDIVIGGSSANTRQSRITKKIQSGDRGFQFHAATGATNEDIAFFSDNTTERMRIHSTGQVGMGTNGTATASSTTDLTIRMTPATSAFGIYSSNFSSGTTATPGGYGVYGHMGGLPPVGQAHYGVYGKVDTNSTRASGGIIGYSINNNTYGIIGYWSTAAYYGFYTNGAVYAASGYSSSDARLKDIVSDGLGTGILDKVCQLQAKKFTWKENTQQRRGCESVQIGLLAQDVQIDFPEVVDSVKQTKITGVNPETLNEQLEDNLAVDYGKLVPILVEALKEAKERIETLETKVATLEGGAS